MRLNREKIHAACVRLGKDCGFEMTWCLALDSNQHVIVAFYPVNSFLHGRVITEVDAGKFSMDIEG